MSRASRLAALSLVGTVLFGSADARADAAPKISDSLWLPVGLNVGYSMNPDPSPNGFLVGPEASFVYIDRSAYWAGVYTDALYDTGREGWRLSAGLEGGLAIFGVDVGYVAAPGVEWGHGLRARLLVSLAAIHLYGGVGAVFDQPGSDTYGELGLLLKFPIQLWQGGRDYPNQRYAPLPEPEPAPPGPGESHRPWAPSSAGEAQDPAQLEPPTPGAPIFAEPPP